MGDARGINEAAAPWRAAGLVVFLVSLGTVLLTLDDLGLAWDEPFSILSGRSYAAWFARSPGEALGRAAIAEHWGPNHEHPPLAKLVMGLSQWMMGEEAGLILPSRFAVAVLYALLVEAVFLLGGRWFGGLAGVLGAASLLCMPRVFGHAHLATLDVAMALAWLVSAGAFARAVRHEGRGRTAWCALAGLCFGLALLTKINAVFLPVVFAGWGLASGGRRAVVPLLWTLVGGAAVFLAGWPWLWLDPVGHVRGYLFPRWRVDLPVLYFGRVYLKAPWHYPLVMTAVTLPVGILFLALVGLGGAVRQMRRHPMEAFVVVNVAVGLGAFVVPGVPKYDGVRLFLPAFPFLALLAGVGGRRGWEWVARRWPGAPRRPLFLAAVFFVTQAGAVVAIHPYELSYFNALTAGLWGAERLGLEVTYWHECVNRELFAWLNRRCQPGHVVAFYPVGEQTVRPGPHRLANYPNDFYEMAYLDQRKRLRATRLEEGARWDFLVLNAREAMLRGHAEAWRVWTTQPPIFEIRKQGVRLVAVYGREPPP